MIQIGAGIDSCGDGPRPKVWVVVPWSGKSLQVSLHVTPIWLN